MKGTTLKNLHVSDHLIRPALVMSPIELREEALTLVQDASEMQGHAIAMRLPERLIRQFERARNKRMRLSIYPSPRGVMVACFTLQADGAQVRTVADCRNESVQHWLRSLSEDRKAQLLVEIEESEQVGWVCQEVAIPSLGDLLACAKQTSTLNFVDQFAEFALMAAELGKPETLESLVPGHSVSTTVIALVVPEFPTPAAVIH